MYRVLGRQGSRIRAPSGAPLSHRMRRQSGTGDHGRSRGGTRDDSDVDSRHANHTCTTSGAASRRVGRPVHVFHPSSGCVPQSLQSTETSGRFGAGLWQPSTTTGSVRSVFGPNSATQTSAAAATPMRTPMWQHIASPAGRRACRGTMHNLIRIATRELVTFLSMHLPALGPEWWTTHVEERLTYTQQQRVRERGLTRLDQLDFAALLRIVDRNWFELSQAANLPREGRDWVRELQTVRNKWAHASAEQEASEDIFRDADTLGRCLRMLGAGPESLGAAETVKFTALRDMAAEGGVRATPSERAPAPYPTKGEATVEVRDHALWTKHIRGDDRLKATLNGLRRRSQIELEVDGFHGTWQKMDDGKDGRPTAGIKPLTGAGALAYPAAGQARKHRRDCACIQRA